MADHLAGLMVARLVAEDLADKEIASILRISPRTVQATLDRIGKKLGASGIKRRRAIARWIEQFDAAA